MAVVCFHSAEVTVDRNTSINRWVIQVIAEVLETDADRVNSSSTLMQLGITDDEIYTIARRIHHHLGIFIPPCDQINLRSVQDIIDACIEHNGH